MPKMIKFTYVSIIPDDLTNNDNIVNMAFDVLKDTIKDIEKPDEIFKIEETTND